MHKITAEELNENAKKYYGSYVNYGVDLDGNSETSDWKLFYVGGSDKDDSNDVKGRIYIIAADYVPMADDDSETIVSRAIKLANMEKSTIEGNKILSAGWISGRTYELSSSKRKDTKVIYA